MPVRIHLLGPVTVTRDGRPLDPGPPQRRAVLAVLAAHAGQPVPLDELIAALWPGPPPASAAGAVYNHVSALRRTLEPDHTRYAADGVLSSTGDGYELRGAGVEVDAAEFLAHRDEAARARLAGDTAAERRALRAALDLYTGPALAGLRGPFAQSYRRRLDELHRTAADRLAALPGTPETFPPDHCGQQTAMRAHTGLLVTLLGPVRATRDGVRLHLGPSRQRAVFALLAAHAGRALSRDEIVDAVWGESAPPSAAGSVYTYVHGLRRILEPDRELLLSTPEGYLLDVRPDAVDIHLFAARRAAAERHAAAADPAAAVAAADDALALWQGAPFTGVGGPFADLHRHRLADQRLSVVEHRARLMLLLGRDGDLIAELTGLVHEHPLRESLYALLMRALDRRGRTAEAMTVYRQAARTLGRELGVEPGSELRLLHQRMRAVDRAHAEPLRRRSAPEPAPPPAPRGAALVGTRDAYAAIGALRGCWRVSTARGEHLRALRHAEEALDLVGTGPAADARLAYLRLDLAGARIRSLQNLDRLTDADAALRAVDGTSGPVPPRLRIAAITQDYWRGRWAAAARRLERRPAGHVDQEAATTVPGVAALIAVHGDDLRAARAELDTAADHPAHGLLLAARTAEAARRGGHDEALRLLAGVLDPAHPDSPQRGFLLPLLVRAALRAGRRDLAEAATAASAGRAEPEPGPVQAHALADRCRALLTGDPEPALRAAAQHRAAGWVLETATALEDAAVLLARAGRPGESAAVFQQTVEIYTGLGARWDVRRATTRLLTHAGSPLPG